MENSIFLSSFGVLFGVLLYSFISIAYCDSGINDNITNNTNKLPSTILKEDVITSHNVEMLKRAENSVEAATPSEGNIREGKALFSWWSSDSNVTSTIPPNLTPSTSTYATTMVTTVADIDVHKSSEKIQEKAEVDEKLVSEILSGFNTASVTSTTPFTVIKKGNNGPTKKMYSWWTRLPIDEGDVEISVPSTTEVNKEQQQASTKSPSESNSKPAARPTKRPSLTVAGTKRPSSSHKSTTHKSTIITIVPAESEQQNDPFGVKKKFSTIAKVVGKVALDHAGSLAISTAEKVAPIAKDKARHVGILALNAASHVGTFTKNVAEQAYGNLAKKLNATEDELNLGKNPRTTTMSTTTSRKPKVTKSTTTVGSIYDNKDRLQWYDEHEHDESCGSMSLVVMSKTSTLLSTFAVLLFRIIL